MAYLQSDPPQLIPETRFNTSKAMLGLGSFAQAWELAESRFALSPRPEGVRSGPYWEGWPQVSEITVWHEQGLGDTLQFLRWIPAVLEQGRSVRLLVQQPLHRMVSRGMVWCGSALSVEVSQPGEQIDGCHGSLLSLPWRLNQARPPWPREPGYLQRPSSTQGLKGAHPRLGLLWGAGRYLDGYLKERDYRRKSLLGRPLLKLLRELNERPLELVNLQTGPDRTQAQAAGSIWADGVDPAADFYGLAEKMVSLDLVLCVDTAGAHLAGALGLETWLLLPWAAASRWQRHTNASAWYPSLRLWRQPRHGDWDGLWPELLVALDQRFAINRSNKAW